MSRLRCPTPPPALTPLRPLLVHWLTVGLALVVLLPAARSYNLWIGWLPYWLIVAPLLCLGVIDGLPKLDAAKARWAKRIVAKAEQGPRKRLGTPNRRLPRRPSSAAQSRRARLVALLNGFPTSGV